MPKRVMVILKNPRHLTPKKQFLKFAGTLIFVSHDREFVSSLATRIIDIKLDHQIVDYRGSYEEYLASQGVA